MCRMSLALVFPDRDGLQVARALGVLAPGWKSARVLAQRFESCGPVEIASLLTEPCHRSYHLLWPKADARMSHTNASRMSRHQQDTSRGPARPTPGKSAARMN